MKIQIILPISNTTDYKERALRAEMLLESLGYEAVNPLYLNHKPAKYLENLYPESDRTEKQNELIWVQYLETCLENLIKVDGVLLTVGWRASRGCRLEVMNAIILGLKLYDVTGVRIPLNKPKQSPYITVSEIYSEIINGDVYAITTQMAEQTKEDYRLLIGNNSKIKIRHQPVPMGKYDND